MLTEEHLKIVYCTETEVPARDFHRLKTQLTQYQVDRMPLPLAKLHHFPLENYLVCLVHVQHDVGFLESEAEAIRAISPQFPLLAVVPPDQIPHARAVLTGSLDTLVVGVGDWMEWGVKEIEKLARFQSQLKRLEEQGCLLAREKSLKDYNQVILEHFLNKYNGSVYEVARRLKIGKSTIYRMLKAGES